MTREQFEDMSFGELLDYAYDNYCNVFSEDTVIDMVRAALDSDNWILADHLLHFVVNMNANHIYWDPSMGTMQEPIEVSDCDDLIDIFDDCGLIDEIDESFRMPKKMIRKESARRKRRYRK